ncbi:hypothetical protein GLOIN_2v1792100 [Rhizophagus clarus]|uniref:Uncharacterized protein n=1 Tax=Rhizophagus clarus TaxID=94130 RepID=A0A8H3R5J0_9GLOM|nr:hypothetical protein GLOIN_2v1792100 [Rhizophagus clarus]
MFDIKPLDFCRAIVIVIFAVILLTDLIILSIGVHNDLPTVTAGYSEMDEFPAPLVVDNGNCSEYLTQPTFNEASGQWTGKFSPINNLTFPRDQISNRLKRILFKFNVPNDVYIFSGEKLYLPYPNVKENTRTIVGSIKDDFGFPPTRKMLTYTTAFVYLTTRNASWYADAASGFMLDPSSFLLEDQTEQRNKNALSVVSNVLAIFGALLTFYAFLFGVSSIKPWGFIHKYVFNGTTKKTLNDKLTPKPTILFSANSNNLELENELIGLKEFLKHYVVNISWLEEDNNKKTSRCC